MTYKITLGRVPFPPVGQERLDRAYEPGFQPKAANFFTTEVWALKGLCLNSTCGLSNVLSVIFRPIAE